MHGLNWYCYVENCPTRFGDYSGKEGEEAFPWMALLHAVAACVAEILGDYAAEEFWKRVMAVTHTKRGIELVEKLHDNVLVKIAHGEIGAAIGFALEYSLLPKAVVSLIGRMGSVGLAFAVGFFVGFLAGFETQEIVAMIGDESGD